MSFKYGDVAFRWTEKVKGDLTGLKYQLPGEELEPDALITVSDDNDVQVTLEPGRGLLAWPCFGTCWCSEGTVILPKGSGSTSRFKAVIDVIRHLS